ncbi:hypothetical protein MHB40_14795 [Lysinibacillus sp. FSL K6-0057]|uniref:hypothetical protein n=1 Tax=Lysinibacillus sp. FSL K6-0057 TaxID=2921411 RepID=UPI00315A3B33
MIINITTDNVKEFNDLIKYYSGENNDATHTGIYVGVKHALESLGIYQDVIHNKKETSFELDEDKLEYLILLIKKNSINALWNIGLASGICWVLEDLGLYKNIK